MKEFTFDIDAESFRDFEAAGRPWTHIFEVHVSNLGETAEAVKEWETWIAIWRDVFRGPFVRSQPLPIIALCYGPLARRVQVVAVYFSFKVGGMVIYLAPVPDNYVETTRLLYAARKAAHRRCKTMLASMGAELSDEYNRYDGIDGNG